MYLDGATLTWIGGGVAAVFAATSGGISWLVTSLWKAREKLQEKVLHLLDKHYADADRRKELWDAQARLIENQTIAIRDLTREVRDLRGEVVRLTMVRT